MKLIFLYGLPASGKLTVAEKLATVTGYKLFHNHLAVDLLTTVFEFGSPEFVALREEIWLSVLAGACESGVPGVIFTFAPEKTVRAEFIPRLVETLAAHGGTIDFVELTCPLPELMQRLGNPSRRAFGKLASKTLFQQLHADGVFNTPMPAATLTVDTSVLSPNAAAATIARGLRLG